MKISKKKIDEICSLIRSDSFTVTEICKRTGISRTTYYDWVKSNKYDISDNIKKAKDEFQESVLVECEKSLVKLVKGYSYTEEKEITGAAGKVKETIVTTKHVAPNLGAIIHYQTNRDPFNWKNRQSTELTGKDGKDLIPEPEIDYSKLSTPELKTYHALLEKASKKDEPEWNQEK